MRGSSVSVTAVELRNFSTMRRLGSYLIWLGVLVAVATVIAIFGHLGYAGATWIINVALAKLSFVAAGGLMVVGASMVRVARVREQRRLAQGDGRQLPRGEID